jgi:hypothetical protein
MFRPAAAPTHTLVIDPKDKDADNLLFVLPGSHYG